MAGVFPGTEKIEQHRLQAVIGAGRVAGGGADAAILLADQRLVGELLVRGIAPQRRPYMPVQPLSEGLGEAVGESLEQDVRLVVVLTLEPGEVRFDAVDADGEAADPVAF